MANSPDDDDKHPQDDDGGVGDTLLAKYATWGLAGLNVAVFIAMTLAGADIISPTAPTLVSAGAIAPARVWDGEVWRLLTACFVHVGVLHLALNMWALLQLGRALEDMIGGPRVLLVYASSGVFGFAASLSLTGSIGAGASGAAFGITGALLALALLVRQKRLGALLFTALLPFVAGTLALGYLVGIVDNVAHVGGLVFGFLMGFGLSAGDRSFLDAEEAADIVVSPRERILGTIALLFAGVLFAGVVTYGVRPLMSPRYHAIEGLAALAKHRVDEAKAHATSAARYGPSDAATFVLLARLRGEAGDVVEQKRLAREAVKRLLDGDNDTEALITLEGRVFAWDGSGPEGLPTSDLQTHDALCEAALAEIGAAHAPLLKNECAWLKLKATDPKVHDVKRGLELAQQAVKEDDGKNRDSVNIIQTLADALAQNDQADEGLALLEKVAAEGRGGELAGGEAFLTLERKRLLKLAEAQAGGVGSP